MKKTKEERRAIDHAIPKCWCGNCIPLRNSEQGIMLCGRHEDDDKETDLEKVLRVIEFAINIDDHYERLDFLKSWSEGDTREWPEFEGGADRPNVKA